MTYDLAGQNSDDDRAAASDNSSVMRAVPILLSLCLVSCAAPVAPPAVADSPSAAIVTTSPVSPAPAVTSTPEPTPPVLAHYDVPLPMGTVWAYATWGQLVALERVADDPAVAYRFWAANAPAHEWRLLYSTSAEVQAPSGGYGRWAFMEVRASTAGSTYEVVVLEVEGGAVRRLDRNTLGPAASRTAEKDRARPTLRFDGSSIAWTKWVESADGSIVYELYDTNLIAFRARITRSARSPEPLVLLRSEPVAYVVSRRGQDELRLFGTATRAEASYGVAPRIDDIVFPGPLVLIGDDNSHAADRVVRGTPGAGAVELDRAPSGGSCIDLSGGYRWASWRCRPLSARLEVLDAKRDRMVVAAYAISPVVFRALHNLFFWIESRGGRQAARIAELEHEQP